ncbi:hypothetical protein HZS_7258 [Henneguya salminicola]|nr:hypothetical protein HZS_7258 [Henneguya salminicola]
MHFYFFVLYVSNNIFLPLSYANFSYFHMGRINNGDLFFLCEEVKRYALFELMILETKFSKSICLKKYIILWESYNVSIKNRLMISFAWTRPFV